MIYVIEMMVALTPESPLAHGQQRHTFIRGNGTIVGHAACQRLSAPAAASAGPQSGRRSLGADLAVGGQLPEALTKSGTNSHRCIR